MGHHPNLTWLWPCYRRWFCSRGHADYPCSLVAHFVLQAVSPSPAVAWCLSQQIFATPRSCYIRDVKPCRLQTDVLLWVIKECIIYCITLMPFDLLKPSSTYRSPRSLRTAVIGIRHIWKFSCPLYKTRLVQGFSFPAKIKIKWQSNKWMKFAEFSPNIMISSAKLLIWCTAEGQGPGAENRTSCKSRRDLLPARFARGFNLTCSFGAYFDALWLIFEGTGFISLPSC